MKIVKTAADYVLMLIGAIIYGIGISAFLDPFNLAPGGVTGIAIIISSVSGISVGILVLIMNVPILILGLIKFGWRMMVRTFFSVAVSSAVIDLVAAYIGKHGTFTENLMLTALTGGVLMAVGMGLILRAGGTTGGSDIVIKVLRQKFKSIKTGVMYIVIDCFVIILCTAVFRSFEIAAYSVISIICSSKLLDLVLYGPDNAALIYIISEKSAEITEILMNAYGLGVTLIDSKGAYTGNRQDLIMCVCKRQNFSNLRETVKQTDPTAFMIVSNASQTFGEGFKDHASEEI